MKFNIAIGVIVAAALAVSAAEQVYIVSHGSGATVFSKEHEAYLFLGSSGESGRRRTRFRCEAEHHSVVIPNSIPV